MQVNVITQPALRVVVSAPGPQGIPGPAGSGGDLTFVHVQGSPASTWTVAHNLNKRPSVTVVDSAGEVCHGDVTYLSDSAVSITFSAGFSGSAYLN